METGEITHAELKKEEYLASLPSTVKQTIEHIQTALQKDILQYSPDESNQFELYAVGSSVNTGRENNDWDFVLINKKAGEYPRTSYFERTKSRYYETGLYLLRAVEQLPQNLQPQNIKLIPPTPDKTHEIIPETDGSIVIEIPSESQEKTYPLHFAFQPENVFKPFEGKEFVKI